MTLLTGQHETPPPCLVAHLRGPRARGRVVRHCGGRALGQPVAVSSRGLGPDGRRDHSAGEPNCERPRPGRRLDPGSRDRSRNWTRASYGMARRLSPGDVRMPCFARLGVGNAAPLRVPELETLGVESHGHPVDRHDGPYGGLGEPYRFRASVAATAFAHALRYVHRVAAGQTPLHQPMADQQTRELSVHDSIMAKAGSRTEPATPAIGDG